MITIISKKKMNEIKEENTSLGYQLKTAQDIREKYRKQLKEVEETETLKALKEYKKKYKVENKPYRKELKI